MRSLVTEEVGDAKVAGNPLIQVEHLSRVIGSRLQKTVILDDVTFSIPAQSLFAINGPSGSGKSTVLNMLTGIDRPSSGRILFAGQELRRMSENALARWRGEHVGIVFQFFQLVPTLTALENVLLALELGGGGKLRRRDWRERAMDCLCSKCANGAVREHIQFALADGGSGATRQHRHYRLRGLSRCTAQ